MANPKSEKDDNTQEDRRLPVTDEQRVDIALARFGPSRQFGRFASIEDLGRRFQRDPSVITRAIKEAFRRGLVTVLENKSAFATEPIREDLDGRDLLMKHFPQLRGATVVKVDTDASVEVHRRLGRAMAQFISTGGILRPNDRLGVGSGRAVYACVEALARLPQLRVHPITLLSLTGSLRASDPDLRLHVDADVHLFLLARCFEHQIFLEPLSSAIAARPDQRESIMSGTWLGGKGQKAEPPTHALVGVGALDMEHRLYQLDKDTPSPKGHKSTPSPEGHKGTPSPEGNFDPALRALLHEDLEPLVGICDEYAKEKKEALVGDLCNWLFLVDDKHALSSQAQTHIKNINRKLITADVDLLKKIGTIMVVSGTQRRCGALLRLMLSEDLPEISYLCTDSRTAVDLVKRKLQRG